MALGRWITWVPNLVDWDTIFNIVEFWVQMHRLSSYAYTEALTQKIWESLPNCIQIQPWEEDNEMYKFFRLHLQINILNSLRRVMQIVVDKEDQFNRVLLYKCLPKVCYNCGRLGHCRQDCTWNPPTLHHLPEYLSYGTWMEAKHPNTRLKWVSSAHTVGSNQRLNAFIAQLVSSLITVVESGTWA